MSHEATDADELFNRIQNSLMMAEAEDFNDDDEEIGETDQLAPPQTKNIDENPIVVAPAEVQPVESLKEKTETESGSQEQTEELTPKKKIYQFTEVNDGKKVAKRRSSLSSQYQAIQHIPIQPPLLRGQDISAYKPSSTKIDSLIKAIAKRNQAILDKMSQNQKAIFQKFLHINMLSEEIMKKSDENLQMTTTIQSANKMREFEVVELRIMKYKPHLSYMTQR